MTTENKFSQRQIDDLTSLRYINRIDQHLKLVSSVSVIPAVDNAEPRVLLFLDIFFDDQKIDDISFNLHNYDYEEIIEIAKNIDSNDYLLQAVDAVLAGEVE